MYMLDSVEQLYNLINSSNQASLDIEDFINFFQNFDFACDLETLNTDKIYLFINETIQRITLYYIVHIWSPIIKYSESFKEGYKKEIQRLKNEIIVFNGRKELEDNLYQDLAKQFIYFWEDKILSIYLEDLKKSLLIIMMMD